MAISDELYLALLSMDAYNRGYDPGISGLGETNSGIGNATFTSQSNTDPNSAEYAASFYASTYTWNGKTVIAYRGYDDLAEDTLTGAALGAGDPGATQAKMAAAFYRAVNGDSSEPNPNIILTGHSLGGLALWRSVLARP
jgi:hypothetical protein